VTVVLIDGFEHQIPGTIAGGGLYSSASANAPTIDTTNHRSGSAGLRANGAGVRGVAYAPGLAELVLSFQMRVTTAVDGVRFLLFSLFPPAQLINVKFSSTNKVTVALNDGATDVASQESTSTFSTGTYVRFEFKVDINQNPWTVDWQMDGVSQTQVTAALAANTVAELWLANWDACSIDVTYDDVVINDSLASYPMGEHKVLGYSPNAVGTHNLDAATSTYFFKDIATTETALTTSETTSYQQIDDVPLSADTDHVLVRAVSSGPGGSVPVHQATVSHTGNPTTAPSTTLGTTAADDVLICVITSGGSDTIPSPAGTYTTTGGGSWTAVDSSALSSTGACAVYWSRCTGNHTGQTVSATTVDSGSLMVSRFNSVYAGGDPIGANKSESQPEETANPSLTAFTTTTANSKVILAVGCDDNLAAITAATAGGNAMSLRGAPTSSGGADSQVGLLDRDQASAGTTGAFATTWGANAAASSKYLLGFELLGAAGAPTQPTNTWYLEHGFADSGEATAPLAVRSIVALKQDSAANCAIVAKLRANANDADIYSGDINSATNIYKTLVSATAPGGAAWTDGIFDGATVRWGYTADADGTPHLDAAMLEALFAVAGSNTYTKSGYGKESG
jgi:hypothetical protein